MNLCSLAHLGRSLRRAVHTVAPSKKKKKGHSTTFAAEKRQLLLCAPCVPRAHFSWSSSIGSSSWGGSDFGPPCICAAMEREARAVTVSTSSFSFC